MSKQTTSIKKLFVGGWVAIWNIESAPVPFLRFEMLDDIDISNKEILDLRDEIDQRDRDRSLTTRDSLT